MPLTCMLYFLPPCSLHQAVILSPSFCPSFLCHCHLLHSTLYRQKLFALEIVTFTKQKQVFHTIRKLWFCLEVDRNLKFLARTRNKPGIRFLFLATGFEIFDLPGSWFGYWFWKNPILLGEPRSAGLVTGKTRKFLVWPRSSWLARMFCS